jgi:hypothetical protein
MMNPVSRGRPGGPDTTGAPGSEARERKAATFKSPSTSLTAWGILALAIEVIALA